MPVYSGMMPIIHPTAIVSPDAQLADDVTVGPWVIIEKGAVIGSGCRILAHAFIGGQVRMGADNEVGYGAIIGGDPQVFNFKATTVSDVIIGDRNIFREYVTIHRGDTEGSSTKVGNDNFIMVGGHLGHAASVGNKVTIANNCLLAGNVEVEDGAVFGGGAVFHQFIRVGKLAMIRGGTSFSKNVPPYVMAYGVNRIAGLNVVGLRRAGMNAQDRMEIKRAFELMYRKGLNVTQALEVAAREEWSIHAKHFFDFIAQATRRGICSVDKKGKSQEE